MQRIDASKLISLLFATEKSAEIKFVLAENPIFKRIIENKVHLEVGNSPQRFIGKNAIIEFIEYIATGSLFSAPQKSIVEMPEKLTAKQWNEEKELLNRIPTPLETSAYFFAPTSYRNILKETDFKSLGSVYLCYEPNETDLFRCVEILLLRYSSLAKKSRTEIAELCCYALECYSGDLVSCDMHFARMENAGLNFNAALAGNPEVNGFHVADALSRGDRHLIELRLSQCESCGEEAASVFMALVYFIKQVCFMHAALEETKDMRSAFDKARIPFPSQGRVQRALQVLTKEKIGHFFIAAPQIEMQLRYQKNAHKWLASELIYFISN
ncbi:hypothetical protein [Fluviispira multicolorata]|uniref:DNA polymerase III, delta subunit n=1 Tax=Fluviispira multicolorata TaxID=2654512 RepID=A0A833N4E4_9BACT|nr:hypothetical protein [Fluviispira multicolorata]KAB8031941.1 hypothetical protein GCL57_04655 [Fluviispira multicolorata]